MWADCLTSIKHTLACQSSHTGSRPFKRCSAVWCICWAPWARATDSLLQLVCKSMPVFGPFWHIQQNLRPGFVKLECSHLARSSSAIALSHSGSSLLRTGSRRHPRHWAGAAARGILEEQWLQHKRWRHSGFFCTQSWSIGIRRYSYIACMRSFPKQQMLLSN